MKIAIEGMDGVGKTTVAKNIEEKHDFIYVDKPLHYIFKDDQSDGYDTLMKVSNKIYSIEDPVIRSWFFGLGNLLCFREFKDKNFVIDRHFVSNYFWNGSLESDEVFRTMINIIGLPDLTVLLYASPEVRIDRIRMRNPNDKDIFDPEKYVYGYDKMLDFLDRFNIDYLFVDTDNKSIDEVTTEVEKRILSLT